MKIINPATGKLLREVPEDSQELIADKFAAAKKAQGVWALTPLRERIAVIARFRAKIEEEKAKMASTLCEEVGKPITHAMNEVKGLQARIDFFLGATERALADENVFQDASMTEVIRHEPLGVIANISAWNYPYFVGSNVFIPALLAGNAVLYKPSEFALMTGLLIDRLLNDSGVPKGVFQTVLGGGTAGRALLEQPIAGVFFTGSYATGKKIAEHAASKMIRVQLELGGKDPAYVCEDADVQASAESTADGAMYNAGQSCCSVERIYVHERIHDAFVAHFVKTVQGFKVGNPKDEGTYIGALTRREVHQKFLDAQVADATRKGAKLLLGGKSLRLDGGFFYEPTVFSGATAQMDLMREETFGPLIGIQKVQGDEEAIALMNDTPYGLTAAVYTKDRQRAENLLARVNSGSAYWNCCDRVSPRLPWSGRGHSGIGSTLSHYGIQAFTQPKAYHLRIG